MTRSLPPVTARVAVALRAAWARVRGVGSRRAHRRDEVRRLARGRARFAAACVLLGLGVVLVRSAWIMLLPDERLEAKAGVQFHRTVVLEGRRGDILDRDGGILATTVSLPALHADPSRIAPDEVAALAGRLGALLGVPAAEIEGRLANHEAQDVVLARNLEPELASRAVAEARGGRLFIREENRRYYPGGTMGIALLGLVDGTGTGQGGVEAAMDRRLRGHTWQFVQLQDRKGRGLRSSAAALQAAQRGDDVVLTIDRVIQLAAEQALDAIEEASRPLAAHLVALDVRTGEILALANRPFTNPNNRVEVNFDGLRNRAVADLVEPGSVFKPFVVALALDHGVVAPDAMVDCEGGRWPLGRNVIRDDHPHGLVTLSEVVKYSSNIGAAKLALRLGPDAVVAGLRDFGFGRVVESGLPGELAGVLRSPGRIKPIELATTSYGQGVTASTLHLASAVATLANGGVRMKPWIVRSVQDRNGEVLLLNEPEVDRRVVSTEAADRVAEFMITVTEQGGTGTRARVPGYSVAGKTGTAWKVVDGHYSATARISSFIGFLPARDPRVAIAVVVDTPTQGSRYGGIAAAPAFARVGAAAMRHLGIPPEPAPPPEPGEEVPQPLVAEAEPAEDLAPAAPSELAWASGGQLRLPDLTGLSLRDVLSLFDGSGLELAVVGQGRAVAQVPSPGSLVPPGQRIQVDFR